MKPPIGFTIAVWSGGDTILAGEDEIPNDPGEGGPEETMTRDDKPVIGQPRRLTVNVSRAPGYVGKTIADITAVRMMAKRSPEYDDSKAVYDTGPIEDGDELTRAQTTGEFYVFLQASDFGEGKILPGIRYYFVGAVKVDGINGWIEVDPQTRIEFKDDVID